MASSKVFAICGLFSIAMALGDDGAVAADAGVQDPSREAAARPAFDVSFGVAGVTDYRFRGVSNSDKDPTLQGYVELQAFDWVYAGVWASGVDFPNPWSAMDGSVEIDFYGGLRRSWGDVTLDVGGLYYYYPGQETRGIGSDVDYWELYAKPTVAFSRYGSLSVNAYWTGDYFDTGSNALYLSVIPKFNVPLTFGPDVGFYVSGELGRQWFSGKTTDLPFRWTFKDYLTWNIGGGVTYKAMTVDVRYSDTDLSKRECVFNAGSRGRCGAAVIGKVSFDFSFDDLR